MSQLQSFLKISLFSSRQDVIYFCRKAVESKYSLIVDPEPSISLLELSTIKIIDAQFLINHQHYLCSPTKDFVNHSVCVLTPDISKEAMKQIEDTYPYIVFFPSDYSTLLIKLQNIIQQTEESMSSITKLFSPVPQLQEETELLGKFQGTSLAVKQLRASIKEMALNSDPLLLLGETGSGKTTAAQVIHDLSNRKGKKLEQINMGTVVETLAESTFFGTEKGSYTDAVATDGVFTRANKSTLLLDEIGTTPFKVQAKLLTVLESGLIKKVGNTDYEKVDVRIISSTNSDIKQMIYNGEFRLDLFNRISDNIIILPPLRERREDIRFLCDDFIKDRNCRFSETAYEKLENYDWPGNIRELHQCIKRAISRCTDGNITAENIDFGLFNKGFLR